MGLDPVARFTEALNIVKEQPCWEAAVVAFVGCAETVSVLGRGGSEEDRTKLRLGLVTAWHNVVTPLDIPGIPPIVEDTIDNVVEQVVAVGSGAAFDKIAELRARIEAKLKAA